MSWKWVHQAHLFVAQFLANFIFQDLGFALFWHCPIDIMVPDALTRLWNMFNIFFKGDARARLRIDHSFNKYLLRNAGLQKYSPYFKETQCGMCILTSLARSYPILGLFLILKISIQFRSTLDESNVPVTNKEVSTGFWPFTVPERLGWVTGMSVSWTPPQPEAPLSLSPCGMRSDSSSAWGSPAGEGRNSEGHWTAGQKPWFHLGSATISLHGLTQITSLHLDLNLR